jgi:rhodanese-related sulfurtransferase
LALKFKRLGFVTVTPLEGGFEAWSAAGLPVEAA